MLIIWNEEKREQAARREADRWGRGGRGEEGRVGGRRGGGRAAENE